MERQFDLKSAKRKMSEKRRGGTCNWRSCSSALSYQSIVLRPFGLICFVCVSVLRLGTSLGFVPRTHFLPSLFSAQPVLEKAPRTISSVFSCPQQLKRWPCHSVSQSLTHWPFDFDIKKTIKQWTSRETCDLWDIWSDRFLEDFQIFGKILDFWKIFRFLEDFQIFGRFSDF